MEHFDPKELEDLQKLREILNREFGYEGYSVGNIIIGLHWLKMRNDDDLSKMSVRDAIAYLKNLVK